MNPPVVSRIWCQTVRAISLLLRDVAVYDPLQEVVPQTMPGKQENDLRDGSTVDACSDRTLTDRLKDFLKDRGADLVGIGSVDRLVAAPEAMQPTRYLPDARALISIGLRINEAVCDLIARSVRDRTVPASYHSYQLFTLTIVNPQLDTLAYQGAKFLEAQGYRAYPFPANMPHELKPSAEYPGGPGDVSHRHVAVACGLGQIGWHSMLITPQFGARQKLTTIATNAPLVARRDLRKGNSATPRSAASSVLGHARPRRSPQRSTRK